MEVPPEPAETSVPLLHSSHRTKQPTERPGKTALVLLRGDRIDVNALHHTPGEEVGNEFCFVGGVFDEDPGEFRDEGEGLAEGGEVHLLSGAGMRGSDDKDRGEGGRGREGGSIEKGVGSVEAVHLRTGSAAGVAHVVP